MLFRSNRNEKMFEEARLEASLQRHQAASPASLVNQLFSDVQEFSQGVEQSDDITCLALRYSAK